MKKAQKINIFEESISIEKTRSSLAAVAASIFEDKATGHFYKIPSPMGKEATMIYRQWECLDSIVLEGIFLGIKCSVTKKRNSLILSERCVKTAEVRTVNLGSKL